MTSLPRIPLVKPWLPIDAEYRDAVGDIVQRRFVSNWSKYCDLMETQARAILQNEHTLAASSCDIGLILAWRALGLRGGEVIAPSFTFCSTTNALMWNGLTPVFADIDPESLCVDPRSVAERITDKTVGIVATHTFGRAAPIAPLQELATAHGLALVFDAAHAIGTTYHGASVGQGGDASVFSLSGTKIATSGEGGLISVKSADVADKLVSLRSYGFIGDYNCTDIGLNGKISEANAAMGWLSLQRLGDAVARRNELAATYREQLADLPLTFQQAPDAGDVHGYTYFSVLLRTAEERERTQQCLDDANAETKRYFLPVHGMDAYREFKNSMVPVTADVYSRILCLPLFHEMTESDLDRVRGDAHRPGLGRVVGFLDSAQLAALGLASCGDDVLISDRCSIYGASNIHVGSHVRIDDFTIITARDPVHIGSHVHISCYAFISGSNGVRIGDFAGISIGTVLLTSSEDFSGRWLTGPTIPNKYRRTVDGPIAIGRHVVVCTGSLVMPGVTIGDGTIVGAGSFVPKSLEPWSMYFGRPARRKGPRRQELLELERELLAIENQGTDQGTDQRNV